MKLCNSAIGDWTPQELPELLFQLRELWEELEQTIPINVKRMVLTKAIGTGLSIAYDLTHPNEHLSLQAETTNAECL